MPATRVAAQEVFTLSGGMIDLRNELVPQRPFIGPRVGRTADQ
ncbi:hypothetical protein [Mycobacterium haemophilum]